MIIPSTRVEFINSDKGFGVIATAPIPKGTITWVFDAMDRQFDANALEALPPLLRESVLTYSYTNRHGQLVFCWDNERFINHSFHANCCHTPYNVEIAVRDIAAGEELTDDYGFLNIIEPFSVDSEGTERTTVYPDDLLRHHTTWDLQLAEAYKLLPGVAQPLQTLIPEPTWQTLLEIGKGTKEAESILSCYYPRR